MLRVVRMELNEQKPIFEQAFPFIMEIALAQYPGLTKVDFLKRYIFEFIKLC